MIALWREGRREEALQALEWARTPADAMLEITAYTVRHTMATEMRRRGAPVWEIAGFLGHLIGHKTGRCAKLGPEHLAGCVQAIDACVASLDAKSTAMPDLCSPPTPCGPGKEKGPAASG